MGIEDKARSSLAKAHDGWEPPDDFARADFDQLIAQVHLDLGRLDIAEQFASASLRTSDTAGHHMGILPVDITLATIHVKAAEPDGILLAKTAIGRMSTLSSPRSRQRLEPLAVALETRSSSDARQLARMARQVATVRA